MRITIARLLYYTTLVCVALALFRFLGFDSTCIKPLFFLPMLVFGYTVPGPETLTMPQTLSVILGGFIFIVACLFTLIGLIHLHIKMLDWTKVAGKKEGE